MILKINRKQALKKLTIGAAGLMAMPEIGNASKPLPLKDPVEQKSIKELGEAPKSNDLRNAALIIVDMQNDFVRVGAPLEVFSARETIAAQKSLIQAFHKHSLPVVYTRFISHPHYYLLWEWSPECKPPTKCCWKGHQRFYKDIAAKRDCSEIIDELRPDPGDTIIEKFGYGAFHETLLEKMLHSFGVNAVIVAGTVTQICVEETAREAFHHGFRTTIVEDCVSSFASDLHAATLKNFNMKFGWVSNSEKIIASL